MTKILLIFVLMLIQIGAYESLVLQGERKLVYKSNKMNYQWRIITNPKSLEKYLEVIVVSNPSQKIVEKRKYALGRLMVCESEPGENDECMNVAKVSDYPNPIILLKASKGTHSQTLKIYDPHKSTLEPIAEYFGAYFVDYEIGKANIEITYDVYCDKEYPCERKVYWR